MGFHDTRLYRTRFFLGTVDRQGHAKGHITDMGNNDGVILDTGNVVVEQDDISR